MIYFFGINVTKNLKNIFSAAYSVHASGPDIDPMSGTFFREDLVMKTFLLPLFR